MKKNKSTILVLLVVGALYLVYSNRKAGVIVPPLQKIPKIDIDTIGFDYDLFTALHTFTGNEIILNAEPEVSIPFSLVTYKDTDGSINKVFVLNADLKY
jgi:hypothetical protein